MERNTGHVSFNIGEPCRNDYAQRSPPSLQYSSADRYVIKKNLRRLIRKLVYEKMDSLANVKSKATKVKNGHPFTVEDNNYIERKYKKYCTQFWLEESTATIKALSKTMGHTAFKDFLCISDSIQNLSQIPSPWNVLNFYKTLMDHRQLISDNEDIDMTNTWKQLCLEQILHFSSTLKAELEFITAFIQLLSSLKCYKAYIDELNLYGFFNDSLSFDEIKQKITSRNRYSHDENHKAFLRTISTLHLGNIFYIKDIFQSVVDEFSKPPIKKLVVKDGRDIIEVMGVSLVVSEILEGLEEMLASNPYVIEVRFIAGSVIHVDASLTKDIWRGKNVVVFAKMSSIHGDIVWNISGKDCNHRYPNSAGTDELGNGCRGRDGIAGESGGNALIQVQDMDQPHNFQIVSNGGRGGRGQDGGKGKDGLDGVGISHANFKKFFPTVAKLNYFRAINNLQTTLNFIQRCNLTDKKYMDERTWTSRDIFVDGETEAKQQITFSSYGTFQAFLVCKGSPGQQEGRGGQYGLGGQGGYNGDIVSNISKQLEVAIAEPGPDGEKGNGGPYGSCGKNGWDIGYTDCKHWRQTEYFGSGANSKLKLNFYDNDRWGYGRIWCPFYKKYITVTATTIDNKTVKTYQHRNNTRDNFRRQLHSEASRKKTISERNVLSEYSRHLTVGTSILQNFKTNLENMERHASKEMEKVLEREQSQTMEQRVTRNVTFFLSQSQRNDSVLLNELEQGGRNAVINCQQPMFSSRYSILFETLLIIRDDALIIDETCPKLTTEASASFLEIATEKNNYSHTELGPLNQYIYENTKPLNKAVFEFCTKNYFLGLISISIPKQAMKAFILEAVNDPSIECEEVKQCYNEYTNYLKKRECSLNDSLKSFIAKFSNPEYHTLWELWQDCIRDRSLIVQLDRKINKNKLLKQDFGKIVELIEGDNDYDWAACCNKEKVKNAFKHHIRKYGALSKTYRELLAVTYNVNIRCFIEKNNCYDLIDDHNNTELNRVIYLVIRGEEILEMNANEMYFVLKEERKRKGNLYMKILADIDLMTNETEIKGYFDSKTFRNCSNDSDMRLKILFNEFSTFTKEHVQQIVLSNDNNCQKKNMLAERLQKLSRPYIANNGILYYLLHKFSIEGIHVTSLELCYMINYILASVANGYDDLFIFSWIIASKDQKNWMNEFLLMNLQNYFKKLMDEELLNFRTCLSNIPNKEALLLFQLKLDMHKGIYVTEECVSEIFQLLTRLPNVRLRELERLGLSEWPYCLNEQFLYHKLSSETSLDNEQVSSAVYYLLRMENKFGKCLTIALLNQLIRHKMSPICIMKVLSSIHNQQWTITLDDVSNLYCDTDGWIEAIGLKVRNNNTKDRNADELYELMSNDANNSKGILEKLSDIKDAVKKINNKNNVFSMLSKLTEKVLNIGHDKSPKSNEELLSDIDNAIKQTRKFNLRDTQKMSVLMLLENDRNTLAQISTGEGKSLIIVALSIIKAYRGEKVHVVTSSPVLAKRDAKLYKDLYKMFNVNVGHNCIDNLDKRKQAFSNNQVIYSDLGSLQRDYLLDKFYQKNILGDHKFENVVIDEVDSMLVDKGNNMLYLAHDIAGFDKLEAVYIYIWQMINNPDTSALDVESIKDVVLYDLFGIVKRNDLLKIDSSLSDNQINILWHYLLEYKIIDYQGKLLDVQDIEDLEDMLPDDLRQYAARLYFFLGQRNNRNNVIQVPNYLKGFIETHLAQWIVSARTALVMEESRDYVVDTDRTGYGADRSANVTILDRDTGTDQASSQYDEALHQFLQLKHGCKVSLQCLKSLYISNVLFFKLYARLYGLTGTLGSQRERDLLKEIHNVDFVTLPTSKVKRFHLKKPIQCTDENEWIRQLLNESRDITEQNRSMLIICDTVRDVTKLEIAFTSSGAPNVQCYKRDFEEIKVFNELPPKHIIIATNLAGRGTDIILTDELKKAGGLHVCMSYLAKNSRTGEQGFGRAARCGEKGSGRLIVLIPQESKTSILEFTKQRDTIELQRLSEIKSYYELRICTEENYFKKFKECYEHLNKYLTNQKQSCELRRILLDNCLDKWALWLDGNTAYINNISDDHCRKSADDSLHEFLTGLKRLKIDEWSNWCDRNPIRLVRLGKYLATTNRDDEAIKLFDEVIEQEPHFSEGAHYYKAYVIGKKLNPRNGYKKDIENIKFELRNAHRLMSRHSLNCKISLAVITKLKRVNPESVIQTNAYEEQKIDLCTLYSNFCQSIDVILGSPVNQRAFTNTNINEEMSQIIYKDLLRKKFLKSAKVRKEFTQAHVNTIGFKYGISHDKLYQFLKMFKNKKVDEDIFRNELRDELNLPSKKLFWKELINNSILVEELQLITIEHENLDKYLAHTKSVVIEKSQLCQDKLLKAISSPNILIFDNALLNDHLIFESSCTLEKWEFKEIIGEEIYNFLERKSILSCNKIATINVENIKSAHVSFYDSIALKDFDNINIIPSDAKKILESLVEQNIIEKSENDEAYRLKATCNEITNIVLPFCPAYENSVKALLFHMFTYRMALQEIEKQLNDECSPIRLQLVSNIGNVLYWELVDNGIVRPVIVNSMMEKILPELRVMYATVMNKEDFKAFFDTNDLRLNEQDFDNVFDHLLERGWIIAHHGGPNQYIIQEQGIETTLTNMQTIKYEQIMRHLLKLRLKFPTVINDIYNFIIRQRKTLKLNNYQLLDLIKYTPALFANPEVQLFSLNALDEIIGVNNSTAFKTFMAVLFGVSQICAGVAIEYFSVRLLHRWSNAIIEEGMNDILYAIEEQDMTWEKYLQYKGAGMTLAYSRAVNNQGNNGVNWSEFGMRIKIRILDYVNETSSENHVHEREVVNSMRRILDSAITGINISSSYVGLDARIESYLADLCVDTEDKIIPGIENLLESHEIFRHIAHCSVVREQTNLEEIIKKFFNEKNNIMSLKIAGKKIIDYMSNKMEKAMKAAMKLDEFGLKLSIMFEDVFIMKEQINEISQTAEKLICKLSEELKSIVVLQENTVYSDELSNESYKHWNSLLCEQTKEAIQQSIISRIRTHCGDTLVKGFKKNMNKNYLSYKSNLNPSGVAPQDNQVTAQDQIGISLTDVLTNMYHEHLSTISNRMRNVELFSAILEENAPLEQAYIRVLVHAIPKVLKLNGLMIVVDSENDLMKNYSSEPESADLPVIYISLLNGKFQIHSSSVKTMYKAHLRYKNNLFDALAEVVPLNMTGEEFARNIADRIKQGDCERRMVEQLWTTADVDGPSQSGRDVNARISDNQNDRKQSGVENNATGYYDARYIEHNFRTIVGEQVSKWLQNRPRRKNVNDNATAETDLRNDVEEETYSLEGFTFVQM